MRPLSCCLVAAWLGRFTSCYYSQWAPLATPTSYIFGVASSLGLTSPKPLSKSLASFLSLTLPQFLTADQLLHCSPMAQVGMTKALMLVFAVVAIFSTAATVSAQDGALAPAPSPDVGSAFSVPLSGAVMACSLVLSLLALLKP